MNVILIFTVLYGIFPLITYSFNRNKKSNEISAILPFVILTFVASIYEFVFTFLLKFSIKYWLVVYNFLAFFIISYYYRKILNDNKKVYFKVSYILFFILLFYVFFNWNRYEIIVLSSYMDSFQTSFVLIFSILWFKKIFNELNYDSLLNNPNFHFIAGLLLYYCGTLVLFLMSNSLYTDNKSMFQYYLLLNVVLNLVIRTLLIIGIWKTRVK